MSEILHKTDVYDFKLYLCDAKDIDTAEYSKTYQKLLKQYKLKKRYKVKKGNLFVGRINAEILTPREKLFSYIEKEYDSKVLLGDIISDDEQEKILNDYMREELIPLSFDDPCFNSYFYYCEIVSKKTFAYGLVHYAMKNYNKNHNGEFWPHFYDEYKLRIPMFRQKDLHYVYREILQNTGREDSLSDNPSNYVDEITMQGFVANHSSKQLFDFLFDFWRLDLNRNVLALSENPECFDGLIEAMSFRGQKLMSHTAHLLAFPKIRPIFKTRVKRIMKLMDDCFWHDKKCKENGNRINHLLNNWMEDSSHAFVKEKAYKERHNLSKERDGIMYRTPVLKLHGYDNSLSLILPMQRLIRCDNNDHPYWVIKTSDGSFSKEIRTNYKHDGISYYVDKSDIDLPIELVLSGFEIKLLRDDNGPVEKAYQISSIDVRLFDNLGRCIDYQDNIVQEGMITALTNDRQYPYPLEGHFTISNLNGLYIKNGEVRNGQIVVFPGNIGVQIGQKFHEGYDDKYLVKGATLIGEQGKPYEIYNELPRLFFKANPDEIDGISLMINGRANKITDKVIGFRLEENLEDEGYILNLSSFIKDDGLYEIFLNYPRMHKQTDLLRFAYLQNFEYEFLNAPYVFGANAALQFPAKVKFEEESEKKYRDNWNYIGWMKKFQFDFAERNPDREGYCDLVEYRKASLTYITRDKKYKILFDIPALFWKFDDKDDYNVKKPADITLKDLKCGKKKLYVTGPFDFAKMAIYTKDDVEIADEESEIKISDTKNPNFDLGKVLTWCNDDTTQSRIKLLLSVDRKEYPMMDVITRSELKDVTLVGDFENNVLYGEVDLIGDEQYTITIYRNGELVCEDVAIENGRFSVEVELKTGLYESYVYETTDDEDDDFDSGTSSILLNEKPICQKLINLHNLEGQSFTIKGYRDINNKYSYTYFSSPYYLHDLHAVSYSDVTKDDFEILGIWDSKFDDDEIREKMVWYRARLSSNGIDMTVLVTFKDLNDIHSVIIMERKEEDECYDTLTVFRTQRRLVKNERLSFFTKEQKLCCEQIYDDEYYFDIRTGGGSK